MLPEIYIYYAPFPMSVKEAIRPCSDGYTIYLNQNLTREQQLESLKHAVTHIILEHFETDNGKTVEEMENEAHYVQAQKAPEIAKFLRQYIVSWQGSA